MAGDRTKPLDSVELVPTNALVPELNKLFLASGDDGMLRVFRGDSLELLDLLHLEPGPNRVVYEPKSKLVYVGYGGKDAGKDYGEIGIIDAPERQGRRGHKGRGSSL